jgi:membrane protease YdiL (CAAX protease family)
MTGYLKQYPPLLQFVTFIGLFIGFMLLYILFLSTVFPAISGYSILELQNTANLKDPKVIAYLKLTQILYSITVYFAPAAVFAYLWQSKPLKALGMDKTPPFITILLSVLIMFCCLAMVGALGEWNQSWPLPQSMKDTQVQLDKLTKVMLDMPHLSDLFINLILIALVPSIAEELFFRGVLQPVMIDVMRMKWLGVVFTAIIFSAVHGDMLAFMPRILLGFLLGAIYLISGNLWLSIAGHFFNNGMQVIAMYLFQAGYMKTDPSKDEHIAWYLAVASLLVTTGLLWGLYKQSPVLPATETPPEED